jgi:hypothetical protein
MGYIASWLSEDGARCFQLMETEDPAGSVDLAMAKDSARRCWLKTYLKIQISFLKIFDKLKNNNHIINLLMIWF